MADLRSTIKPAYLGLRRRLSTALVERPQGIETAREVSLDALGLAAANRVRYEPSGWLDLRRILRPSDVSASDVFIDVGSGKGRVVLQAARYPFRRVIGVELSERLNAVARANVAASAGSLACGDIELVTADILTYELPDDVTVAYVYNPFTGDIFQALVDRLLASVDRNPRPLRLIYRTPLEERRLLETGRFRELRVAPGLRPGRAWSQRMSIKMYAVEPLGATVPAGA
jgi:SAM-dependent methyltransferase